MKSNTEVHFWNPLSYLFCLSSKQVDRHCPRCLGCDDCDCHHNMETEKIIRQNMVRISIRQTGKSRRVVVKVQRIQNQSGHAYYCSNVA